MHKHLILYISVLFLAAFPIGAATPSKADGPQVIKLQRFRKALWKVHVTIKGKEGDFLFDTGGGVTLLTEEFSKGIECKYWGRNTGYNMFGKRFEGPACNGLSVSIAGRRYVPAITGLVNMAALNPADSALDGIAALDLFDGRAVTLDLSHGRLIVESPASLRARVGAMRPLPIRLKREVEGLALAVTTGIPTSRGWLWMELDSGNGGTVLVSKPVAALVGLDSSVAARQPADFAVTDGVRVHTTDAFTPDLIMDGNLGMPFLRNWVITLDLQAGTGWIAPVAEVESASAR